MTTPKVSVRTEARLKVLYSVDSKGREIARSPIPKREISSESETSRTTKQATTARITRVVEIAG